WSSKKGPSPELEKKIDALALSLSSLGSRFSLLESRVSSLEDQAKASSKVVIKPLSSDEFKSKLRRRFDSLNLDRRYGGLVPIPELWDAMSREGINRQQFEQGLFDLERSSVIDLQIASDTTLVKEPEKAIKHPTRGLVAYVGWRR
ncbi:MAG TPA: hypothetical protein VJ044_07880, partial [Candidatus Hodarchaeales archaeon]|nr:hypothetical protein [Candidatus Hodarchaeales archaeon]